MRVTEGKNDAYLQHGRSARRHLKSHRRLIHRFPSRSVSSSDRPYLARNLIRVTTLFTLPNQWIARGRLGRLDEEFRPISAIFYRLPSGYTGLDQQKRQSMPLVITNPNESNSSLLSVGIVELDEIFSDPPQ
jgi:hypothetical protein